MSEEHNALRRMAAQQSAREAMRIGSALMALLLEVDQITTEDTEALKQSILYAENEAASVAMLARQQMRRQESAKIARDKQKEEDEGEEG